MQSRTRKRKEEKHILRERGAQFSSSSSSSSFVVVVVVNVHWTWSERGKQRNQQVTRGHTEVPAGTV